MKQLYIYLLCALALAGSAFAQGPTDPNEGCRLSYDAPSNTCTISWFARSNRNYFIQQSEDLNNWIYLSASNSGLNVPIMETGSDAVFQYGFNSSAIKCFWRLQFDNDQNGIADAWELKFTGTTGNNPFSPSIAADGYTLLQEFQLGRNPNDSYNGVTPVLSILQGTPQTYAAGMLFPQPLIVQVTNGSGVPFVDDPVTFNLTSGSGGVSLLNFGPSQNSITFRTDTNGCAQVYFRAPTTTSGTNLVSVSAGNATPVVFTEIATPAITIPTPLIVSGSNGWNDLDIGDVGLPGGASYNNGAFTVQGAGAGVTWEADGFNFLYIPMTGNAEIIVRVSSLTGGNSYAIGGIMFRETLASGAANAMVSTSASNGVNFEYRVSGTSSSGGVLSSPLSTSSWPPPSTPVWLRLVRSGSTFAGYQSTDGINWTLTGKSTISMANNFYAGFAVSSSVYGTLCTDVFDHLSVLSNVPQVSSNLKVWLRSDVNVGTSGSSVSRWQDQSENGNDAVQAVSLAQPTLTGSAVNGLPGVTFDGTNSYLQLPSGFSDFTQGMTVIAVAKPTSTANNARIIDFGTGSPQNNLILSRSGTTPNFKLEVFAGGTDSSVISTGTITNNQYQVFEAVHNGITTASLLTNGISAGSGNINSIPVVTRNNDYIGKSYSGSDGLFKGDIAELLIFNRALSSNERTDLESYIYQKYGIGTQPTVPTPTTNIPTGTYSGPQQVTLSTLPGSIIYYTTNGTQPTVGSSIYTTPIPVNSTTTINSFAIKQGYLQSPVLSSTITIDTNSAGVSRTGLQCWLRADVGATPLSGSSVGLWQDQSSNLNNVTQIGTGNQPTFQSNVLNGNPVIHFNATVSQYFNVPNFLNGGNTITGATQDFLTTHTLSASVGDTISVGLKVEHVDTGAETHDTTMYVGLLQMVSGTMPLGLQLVPSSDGFSGSVVGVITGTAGTYTFTFQSTSYWKYWSGATQYNTPNVTQSITYIITVANSGAGGPAASAAHILAVIRVPQTTSTNGLWTFGTDTTNGDLYTNYDGKIYTGFGSNTRKSGIAPGKDVTQFQVYEVCSKSGTLTSWMDGSVLVQTNSNSVGFANSPLLGKNSTGAFFTGDLAEVLVYNRALSDQERQNLELYIYQKYQTGTQPTVSTPVSSVVSGTYGSTQTVTLNSSSNSIIHYTIDGTAPTLGSPIYNGPITLSTSGTIQAFSVEAGYITSGTLVDIIGIDPTLNDIAPTGLQLWLRADLIPGSNGSSVSQWLDPSGNGNNVSQGTSSNQPTLITGTLNGKSVVRFNGSTKFMSGSASSNLNPSTISVIALYRLSGTSSNARLISQPFYAPSTISSVASWGLFANTTALDPGFDQVVSGSYIPLSSTAATLINTPCLAEGIFDGATSRVYLGGTLTNSYSIAGALNYSGSAPNFYLGRDNFGDWLNGDIAEIFVYNRALSDPERNDIEAYLAQKYNLVSKPTAPVPNITNGTFSSATTVTISGLSGATFYYTTNGTTPIATPSEQYNGPFVVSTTGTTTVNVLVTKAGYNNSSIGTGIIIIDPKTTNVPRNGMGLWLRADSISGTAGSLVSQWQDQSGYGNSVSQGTTANMPTLLTGTLNSKPAVKFNGTTAFLTGPATPVLAGSNVTMIAVYQINGTAVLQRIVGSYSSSTQASWGLIGGTNTTTPKPMFDAYVTALGSYFPPIATSTTATSLNKPYLVEGLYNGTAQNIYLQGTLTGTYSLGVTGTLAYGSANQLYVGGDSIGERLNGFIAELLVYNRALSTTERQYVESYLYDKYLVGTQVTSSAPSIGLTSGTYSAPQLITLSSTTGAAIYYTIDGTNPTTGSQLYSVPFTLYTSGTIKSISVTGVGFSSSVITSSTITITGPSKTLVATSGLQLWLQSGTGVTVSGSLVTQWNDQSSLGNNAVQATGSAQPFYTPASVNGWPTVSFNGTQSLQVQNSTNFNFANPTLFVVGRSIDGGNFTAKNNASASDSTRRKLQIGGGFIFASGSDGASISAPASNGYFHIFGETSYAADQNTLALDGTESQQWTTLDFTSYNSSQLLIGSAFSNGLESLNGDIAEILIYNRALTTPERLDVELYFYMKYGIGIAPPTSPPNFSVPGAISSGTLSVALSGSGAPGATIYYTTDGSTPTTTSGTYTTPITVTTTTVINAIAVKYASAPSAVASATYLFETGSSSLTTTQLSLTTGTLSAPSQVAINAPAGTSIYYTTDGTAPTTSSNLYTGPINVLYSETIRAQAFKNGLPVGNAVTANFTLDSGLWPGPVNTPGDTTLPDIILQLPTNAVLQ